MFLNIYYHSHGVMAISKVSWMEKFNHFLNIKRIFIFTYWLNYTMIKKRRVMR